MYRFDMIMWFNLQYFHQCCYIRQKKNRHLFPFYTTSFLMLRRFFNINLIKEWFSSATIGHLISHHHAWHKSKEKRKKNTLRLTSYRPWDKTAIRCCVIVTCLIWVKCSVSLSCIPARSKKLSPSVEKIGCCTISSHSFSGARSEWFCGRNFLFGRRKM